MAGDGKHAGSKHYHARKGLKWAFGPDLDLKGDDPGSPHHMACP